jgi:G3E family GTPase
MDKAAVMIPVILVTGFLGSGKTTLINRLIAHFSGRVGRLAVMINEFASIGIDGALVPPGDYVKIELNKGSIFCSCMRSDFIGELKKLALDVKPDLLLIEATGIARVDDLYGMMRLDGLDSLIHIQKNICVVDARNFFKVEQTLEASGIQVDYADVLILNKIDQADDELVDRTLKLLAKHNDRAPVYHALFGDIPPELVFTEGTTNLLTTEGTQKIRTTENTEKAEGRNARTAGRVGQFDPLRVPDFHSCSLKLDGVFNREKWRALQDFFSELGVLRAKGIIRFPEGLRYFEIINGEYSEKDVPPAFVGRQQSIFTFVARQKFSIEFTARIKACSGVIELKSTNSLLVRH